MCVSAGVNKPGLNTDLITYQVQSFGHTHTKNLFVICLKFKFNWVYFVWQPYL